MTTILVTGRDGVQTQVDVPVGSSLMEILRDNNLGVEGACGGMAYCGTCHIYLNENFLSILPARDEIEIATTEGLVHEKSNSRLGCQIEITQALDGLAITVAPPET